jgi:hypothetical protein
MTASTEKNLDQARSALRSNSAQSFTAIRGRLEAGRLSNRLLRIADLASRAWADREELTARIRARFDEPPVAGGSSDTTSTGGVRCGTFLYAVHCALRAGDGPSERPFIHNGRIHLLRTERKESGQPGVALLEGWIRSPEGKHLSNFRVWFEKREQAGYPLRFEFRPRSFLRLTFERV